MDEVTIDVKCNTVELEKTLELLKEIRKQKELILELEKQAETARKEYKLEPPQVIPWTYNPCDNCPYKTKPLVWTCQTTCGTL